MRKWILIILVTISVLNLAVPGYCQGPFRKLGRGIVNMLTFPFELPNRIYKVNKTSGSYEAMTYGIWEGACSMLLRAAAGAYEIVSFPLPFPEGYEPILNDPEFMWEKW